jgi:hypothetical protein
MNRIRAKLLFFLLLVVLTFSALTFAGTASAGWTWDENANGWTWDDSAPASPE